MSQNPIAGPLLVVLYTGAACNDLSSGDVAALRQELADPMIHYRAGRYDEGDIIDIIDQFMPDDWRPAAKWEKALKSAGFTRGRPGK